MLAYLYQHYPEKIQVADLAQAAFTSQRECYRLFSQCLHCSPVEYLIRYRLQMACLKLTNSQESLTAISQACGFGSSSYFGKLFLRQYGCTPSAYRRRWQDRRISVPNEIAIYRSIWYPDLRREEDARCFVFLCAIWGMC